ncbi:hypothetical protein [Cellulomonas endophytica]|uniref:hypothetical protein n=1 Tax=Cellulomonas endophytica TaxID=2494735 RepID=UPI001012CDD2|nr:hypothetical protein [Cellulomonas endophytica]
MHHVVEIAGLLASLTGFVGGLPHARNVWRNRHDPVKLSGISVTSQWINLSGQLFWATYALGIGSFWVGAPTVVNGPVALLTIVVMARSRRRAVRAVGGFAVPAAVAGAPRLDAVPAPRAPVRADAVPA